MGQPSILPDSWDVPQVFRDRLGARVGRQRHMAADGHLLLVLHAPPRSDQLERVGRFFWRSPQGAWVSNEPGPGSEALRKHVGEYQEATAVLDRRETEAQTAKEYLDVLEQLAPLHRAARNLYHVLQEARKACPDYRELIDARDQAYEIDRTTELLFSETKNSLEVLVAKRAEEQSELSRRMAGASHRLNILAALFFPIATLTAIFGTNLRHGLEEESPPFVFLAVILIGFILGGMMTWFITRPFESKSAK